MKLWIEDSMINSIEYVFPNNEKNIKLFHLLSKIFKNIKHISIFENKEIHIGSSYLNPKTIFKIDDNATEIQLNIDNEKCVKLSNEKANFENVYGIEKLSFQEVESKLEGHITRIDHTGINLPTSHFSTHEWNNLINYFVPKCNIYKYPTGEPWIFILPATIEENKNEITNFETIREPKFELCYEEYESIITIQLDIEADLSKIEVEELFPNNKGVYFETLEDFYKAVYLDYDNNINIRLDIRFKSERGEFESGEWLVKENGRVKITI